MRSHHVSRVISASPEVVYEYASNVDNLSRWAAGLAQSEVVREGDVLVVESPMGRVTVRFVERNDLGVLDHDVTLPSGTVVTNPVRVLAHPNGAEIVFTVRQIELTDDEFARDIDLVAADLERLEHEVLRQAAAAENRDGLVVSVDTAVTADAVWRALTEERSAWWPDMQFDTIVGSPLREVWIEEGAEREALGQVVEVTDGRALTFVWSETEWPSPLQVAFVLELTATGTRVSVSETGFLGVPDGNHLREEHAEGWRFHLSQLLEHAER
jgi:uncharacterized protein YndB with AHSA1/START domain